jgi:phosphate-selective porin OprO/OprP
MPAPVAPCDIVPPPVPPPFQPPGVLLSLNPLAEPPPAVPIAATMPPASSDSHPHSLPPLTQLPPLQPQPGAPGAPGVLVWGPPAAPVGDETPLDDYWRHGLRFESTDGDFSLFVGGRTQFDVVGYLAPTGVRRTIPGLVPLEDGVAFRRARLAIGGSIYRNFDFLSEFDFVNGFATTPDGTRLSNAPAPTDLWVQFKNLPWVGNVRVGNQKPLYSFEHITSSRFLNFMERSLGFDAFVENFNNGFAPGVTAFDTYANKRGTWGIGLFKNTRNIFGWGVGRNEAEVNGRLTYLPVYANDGRYLVHVGVGAAHRDLDDDQLRHRARLDARNSPSAFSPLIADTGLFFGSRQQLVIPELVMVAGPLSFQSEYYASWVGDVAAIGPGGVRGANRGTGYFHSVYGEVHYFLTGEHRPYDRNTGAFTRVVPRRPLSWTRCGFTGCGAWQLTARYSYLDLNSKGITGGEIHDMTLGLNWFLNPNMKLQWNYFLAHRNALGTAADGYIQGFGMRTAIDF